MGGQPPRPSVLSPWLVLVPQLSVLSSKSRLPSAIPPNMAQKVYVTYNDVHNLCKESAEKLLADFEPQLMIAIGGGGYVPARILRSFLKKPGNPNIPIQAIGLSLYEQLGDGGDGQVEKPGTKVARTQWLDLSALGEMKNLIGKRILIVDEVDDTRTTLEYAVKELEKDVQTAADKLGGEQPKTQFSIFVLHNKDKQKKGVLPADMMDKGLYHAARTVGDEWICSLGGDRHRGARQAGQGQRQHDVSGQNSLEKAKQWLGTIRNAGAYFSSEFLERGCRSWCDAEKTR